MQLQSSYMNNLVENTQIAVTVVDWAKAFDTVRDY